MKDLISRQAAIDEIDEWIKAFRENGHKESAADACLIQDGIIQLPSAQPETQLSTEDTTFDTTFDCISRAAAIIALSHNKVGNDDADVVIQHDIETLKGLPSAQPEIIRCRNCKFASGDSRVCMKFGHSPIGELDFCAWAERKEE